MATGDIIAATIDSTGSFADITVEGWAASAGNITYAYGDVAGGAGYVKFTVVSEGYNTSGSLGTITRTVYATSTLRKEKPNDASKYETVSGSDLIIRVALDSNVYDDDKNGGAGTSGTDPTLTVTAALWAVSSSPSRTNNAVTALTVTNSSTLDYPVAFGQWDHYAGAMHRTRVKTDFVLAFVARHGQGVACVRLNAVGGTSAVDSGAYVTTQTATIRTASSLYATAYQTTITLSAYTQGETITSRARVYPLIGDANSVLDTSGRTTASNEILGWNEHVLICDKSNALDVIRYVSTSGNDTTGDGSSGNPWATIAKAVTTATVNVVRLLGNNTTHNLGSASARRTSTEWIVVEPDTGVTGCRMEMTTTRVYKCERLMLRNATFRMATTGSWMDGNNQDFIALVGMTFDRNGVGSPTTCFAYQSLGAYVINCTGDINITRWSLYAFSTARVLWHMDGNAFEADNAQTNDIAAWYYVRACILLGNSFSSKGSTADGPQGDGILFEFNSNMNSTHASRNLLILRAIAHVGVSIIGNVFEKTAGTESAVHLWADLTIAAATHIIVAHNTGVGSGSGRRWNIFYNDRGTTAYNHKHVFLYGNHIDEGNIKSDTFQHTPVSITRSGSTATLTVEAATDASVTYAVAANVYVAGATQTEYNGTFAVASNSGASAGGSFTYTVSGTPATPATGTIAYFGLGRVGNWPQLYGINWRANNMDTTSGFVWENLGIDNSAATPSWVNSGADDYTPAAGDGLLARVTNPYVNYDLYGRAFSGSAAIGARQPLPTGGQAAKSFRVPALGRR